MRKSRGPLLNGPISTILNYAGANEQIKNRVMNGTGKRNKRKNKSRRKKRR